MAFGLFVWHHYKHEFAAEQNINTAVAVFFQIQAHQAEKQIKTEFNRLHQVLHAEEAARLKALTDEEEEKTITVKEHINRLTRDIATLSELIKTVKREMGAEDLPFLQVTLASVVIYHF